MRGSNGCGESCTTIARGGAETVDVRSNLKSEPVVLFVHYGQPAGDHVEGGDSKSRTDASGRASVTFIVPANAPSGNVDVDVDVGGRERCATNFAVQ